MSEGWVCLPHPALLKKHTDLVPKSASAEDQIINRISGQ